MNVSSLIKLAIGAIAGILLTGCINRNTIAFGDGFNSNWADNKIQTLWQANTGSSDWSFSLNQVGNQFCKVNQDGEVHLIELATGKLNQQIKLNLEGPLSAGSCDTTRAVVVFVNGDVATFQLNLETKQAVELWRATVGYSALGAPLLSGDSVLLFGSGNRIEAWSASTGVPLWEHVNTGTSFRIDGLYQPLVYAGILYAGLPAGTFSALDTATGVRQWDTTLHTLVDPDPARNLSHIAAPARAVDTICAAAYRGNLGCFEINSGQTKWQREISSAGQVAVNKDSIFIIDGAGSLQALSLATGETQFETHKVSASRTPSLVFTGKFLVVNDGFEGISVYDTNGKRVAGTRLGAGVTSIHSVLPNEVVVQTKQGTVLRLLIDS